MAINAVSGLNLIPKNLSSINETQPSENFGTSFANMLNSALDNTNSLITESDKLTDDLAAGKTDNIHQVMIAAEKADISLQFAMQVRNKILDAYNEIMRMQI